MKLGVPVLTVVVFTSKADIPTLTHVARTLARTEWTADHNKVWTDLHGDELVHAAAVTRDRDQMLAALLLGGTVMSKGVALPTVTNGLAALCEAVLSLKDSFFTEEIFQEKKKLLLVKKKSPSFRSNNAQEIEQLFPLANLHYVCGNDVPLDAKIILFKERVASAVVTVWDSVREYKMVLSSKEVSLEENFKLLQSVYTGSGLGRPELGLLFEVKNNEANVRDESTATFSWLSHVVEQLFTSEYFEINSDGEYQLVLGNGHLSSANCYIRIGELLGLAIMHNVPVRWPLDEQLLGALVSQAPFGESAAQPPEVQKVRWGFYEVTSVTALWGSPLNPKRFFSEQELSDVLRGHF